MPNPAPVAPEQTDDTRATELLAVVHETLLDLNRETPRGLRVALDSSFDRDLALDSLARVELLLRAERRFGVSLPENTLQRAETPRDLLAALGSASTSARPAALAAQRAAPLPPEGLQAEPADAGTLLEVLDWHLREHADRTQIIFQG